MIGYERGEVRGAKLKGGGEGENNGHSMEAILR